MCALFQQMLLQVKYVLGPLAAVGAVGSARDPLLPVVFISVMALFLIAAIVYNPIDSLIGVALTLAGVPVYRALMKNAPEQIR